MRTLLKLFSVIIGVGLLAGAAVILWIAHGPQLTEAVTTGGISYTQQEVTQALAGSSDLEASGDVGGGLNTAPVDVALSDSAVADLPPLEPAPSQPQTAPQLAPMVENPNAVPLTTDVVIDENTAVQVAPMASGAPAGTAGQGGFTSSALGYEQRVVEVEWPAEFQVGRGGAIRIKLKMLDSGALQPVAEIADNEILATPILITDRYNDYNAFVTSNLSAPDFSVQATSPLRQPLFKGGEAEWRYTLKSNKSGHFVISIGLVISWDPIDPNTTPLGPQNVPIWGQLLEVDVNYVFGLITVPQASIAGTALGVLGFLAEAPLLSTVLEWFLGRLLNTGERRRKKEEERRRKEQQRRNRRSRRR